MSQRLPPVAYVLGVGGVLPFIGCGIAASSPSTAASIWLPALIAYGAVILSFVGAVQWGFALLAPGMSRPSVSVRLLAGVLPSLVGWAAVLLNLAALPDFGLVLLIAGFIAVAVVEARWARAGLAPQGYMALRWGLTVLVVMTLVTVLALRLLGASIVF